VKAFLKVPLDELDDAAIRSELQRAGDVDVSSIGATGQQP
jgi:arsenate reductase (thioredoxin)